MHQRSPEGLITAAHLAGDDRRPQHLLGVVGQTIGARTSAKLHADFAGFAAKARRHFLKAPDLAWMWEVYRDFRKAFKLGSDGGFVSYW